MTKRWKVNNKEHVSEYDKNYRIGREDLAEKARQRARRWVLDTSRGS